MTERKSGSPPQADSGLPDGFAAGLVAWYLANQRRLPWRERQDDAYAVWISEIMLQQTTVNAVIGFYERWMSRFPTVQSLAEAPLDDVLKHWAGLGYYARARNLKKTAELVAEAHGGVLPKTVDELMKLPGIGRYTAGAISSIAYNVDAPIVDANVMRVLCRVLALHGDPKTSPALQKQLWTAAGSSIPPGEARSYNQALMELGALVCLSASPACAACPVASHCAAVGTGDPTAFPEFGATKKWIEVTHVACFVEREGKILIVQRPLDQLWGGLWEVPRVAALDEEDPASTSIRAVRETVALKVVQPRKVVTHRHVVTNRKVTLYGYEVAWSGRGIPSAAGCRQFAWVTLEELSQYAMPSPQVELIRMWIKAKKQLTLNLSTGGQF